MRQLILNSVAVAVVAVPAVLAGVGTASADGGTFVAFTESYKRCDFTGAAHLAAKGVARPTALVRKAGSDVVADVGLVLAIPDTPYNVSLIEMPHPSAVSCKGGEPGVVAGVLNTDDNGAGSLTLREPIGSGVNGAWLTVSRPGEFGAAPDEFYATDFVVPI
jgi:hypothetical protein